MKNTNELTVDNLKLRTLVYGKCGTGKTTFACGFPKPYVFDFDNGMLSQRGKNISYDTYTDYGSFQSDWRKFIKDDNYKTLVIDSITTMEEYCQKYVLQLNKKTQMDINVWGVLIDLLQALFMDIKNTDKHVVVTAHEQIIQDGITGEVQILPLISGKQLPAQLGLFFDEVYRMQVGRSKEGKPMYQMITRADAKYTAKSRLRVLETIEVPSYEVIMEKVKRGGEEK